MRSLIIPAIIGMISLVLGIICESVFSLLGGGLLLLIILYLFVYIKNEDSKREARERIEEAFQYEVSTGAWEFPEWEKKKLYTECRSGGIIELSNDYALQKARTVTKAILTQHNIPNQYQKLYSNDEQIKEYFNKGKAKVEAEEAEKRSLEKLRLRTPQAAEMTEDERSQLEYAEKISDKYGIQKRKVMVEENISRLKGQIRAKRDAAEAMEKLGMILYSSAAETPKKDWAVLGGIADGIAGPGAGAAVALNAMAENAQIERQNQQNRAAVNRLSGSLYMSSVTVEADIPELEKEISVFEGVGASIDGKVVLNGVNKEEIYKSLKISPAAVRLTNGNALFIKVTVENNYKPDVPDTVKMTVDGTLTADIYCKDIFVGKAILPLPLYGVECGSSEEITGICNRYLIDKKNYTVKIRPNKLWIMEV